LQVESYGRSFDAIRSLPQVEAKVDMQRRTCKRLVYEQKNHVTRFTCRCRTKIEVVPRQLKFRNLACFARLLRVVGEMHFMCMCVCVCVRKAKKSMIALGSKGCHAKSSSLSLHL